MTTAREIIDDSLYALNKLSVGETADSSTLAICLRILNNIVDEMCGGRALLFREAIIASTSAISTAASVMTAWSGLSAHDPILGMSWSTDSTGDQTPMDEITMQQYHELRDKAATGEPDYWAHDGTSVFVYPVPVAKYLHVRVKLNITAFADTTTDYSMPKGYRSGLAAMLARDLAPIMGGATPAIQSAASAARMRLLAQNVNPAIVDATARRSGYDIERGW
jgi:hypothetical protein